MHRPAVLVSAGLLALVTACGGGAARHPGRYNQALPTDPMVGAETRELIGKLGPPSEILTLPSGRRAYTYASRTSTHRHRDGRPCVDAYVVDADDMVVDFICR